MCSNQLDHNDKTNPGLRQKEVHLVHIEVDSGQQSSSKAVDQ